MKLIVGEIVKRDATRKREVKGLEYMDVMQRRDSRKEPGG